MKAMPRPLNTEWYPPASVSCTARRVVISMRRIFLMRSAGAAILRVEESKSWRVGELRLLTFKLLNSSTLQPSSRHFDLLQDLLDHFFARQILRLRLVRQRHPVPVDVVGDGLHVLGRDEAAVAQKRVRARRQVQVDGGARRSAILDVARHLFQAGPGRVARRENYTNYIILDLWID